MTNCVPLATDRTKAASDWSYEDSAMEARDSLRRAIREGNNGDRLRHLHEALGFVQGAIEAVEHAIALAEYGPDGGAE